MFEIFEFTLSDSSLVRILSKLLFSAAKLADAIEFAQTTYRFLSAGVQQVMQLWNWAPLFSLLSSDNAELRWYVVNTIALLEGLCDAEKTAMLQSTPPPVSHIAFADNVAVLHAVRFLPSSPDDFPIIQDLTDSSISHAWATQSTLLVDIHGILLQRRHGGQRYIIR